MINEFQIEDNILKSYTGREESVIVPEHVQTIGEGAFKACVSLKRVVLPAGLGRIESGAFKGCRKLEKIEIPSGVTYVGDYAFHRCHRLESICLPPSVEELGDCVFLYCDSLVQVGLPGVKRLGKQVFLNDVCLEKLEISPELQEECICDVFTGCSKLREITFSDGRRYEFPNSVEVVAGEMEVPSLVRAIAVDVLRMMELNGRCLVRFLTNLKHVEIPEGIEQIGKSAFFDKRGIISVQFPTTLGEIESRAFRNCISLETVIFRKEQVEIHEDAFKNCSSLKEVRTWDGASYKMEGISSLWGTEIPPLVRTIHGQVLGNFRLGGTILLKYLGHESRVVIPDGVTSIAEEAFAGNEAIDRVILPDSVESIGAGAFRDCLIMQTIHFPPCLTYIGEGAFENCVKLLRAPLPDTLECVEAQVFKHCCRLKEVSFGTRVQNIGEQAFYGCSALKNVDFPDSLVSIGQMAFYRCQSLREVRILAATEHVGNLAFAQSGVKRVQMAGRGDDYGRDIFFQCLGLRTVILKEGVRHIPDKLAYGCSILKQVVLPDTLESVGRNVWEGTAFLDSWLEEGMNEQDGVFWDGRDLRGDVTLPEGTRIVAGGAFYGNDSLTSVTFPDSVTWIGGAALKGCTALRRVIWPRSVTTAQPEVFSGCGSLELVTLTNTCAGSVGSCRASGFEPADGDRPVSTEPEGQLELSLTVSTGNVPWTRIGERAFYNCRKLSHILWKEVQAIGKEAFFGCSSLTLETADSLAAVGERAFEGVQGISQQDGMAVVGSIIVSGKNCVGEVGVPEGITAIAPFAFSGNRRITEVILPETLESIGEGAFWGCNGLKRVTFPSAPCVVGARAFEKCAGLLEVCLHAESVGSRAFAWCRSLERAEIHGLTVLEPRLFEGCESLEQCVCEEAVTIGEQCFCGCVNLRDFDFEKIEEIGSYGFQDCDMLEEIVLRDHTVIRPHGFEDCGRLKRVVLAGSEGRVGLCEYALSGCTALDQVVYRGRLWNLDTYRDILSDELPETVRLIFHSALSCFEIEKEEILRGYRGLGRMVKIPEGIRRIEAEVFQDRLMLENIGIPDTVEYIGARAFHKTAWMERRRKQNPLVVVNHMLLDGSGCAGEVVVPEDIRLVCGWAFAGGMGIESIRFLSDRTKVEAYAFRNCIYLKNMVLADGTCVAFQGIDDRKRELPSLARQAAWDMLNCFKTDEENVLVECTGNISRLLVADGITAIGDRVFQDGNLLTEITLPGTVASIGDHSFAGCKWLRKVYGAEGVKRIGARAFSGCGSLEEIQLSGELTELGARAFENCTSLKEIFLPEGLKEIPARAFFRCHSLERIQIPSTVKRIGKEAFAYCKSLQMPDIPDGVVVEEGAFSGIGTDCRRGSI